MRHKKLYPSYWYNNFAKLCHTIIYYWHKDAHENIPPPAYLIFCVKLKTENQLIRFEAASQALSVCLICGWASSKVPLIRRFTNGEFALMQKSRGLSAVSGLYSWNSNSTERMTLEGKWTAVAVDHWESASTCCWIIDAVLRQTSNRWRHL